MTGNLSIDRGQGGVLIPTPQPKEIGVALVTAEISGVRDFRLQELIVAQRASEAATLRQLESMGISSQTVLQGELRGPFKTAAEAWLAVTATFMRCGYALEDTQRHAQAARFPGFPDGIAFRKNAYSWSTAFGIELKMPGDGIRREQLSAWADLPFPVLILWVVRE